MKILITTDWYKPVINGVVTSVVNLSEGLIKLGHEVRILTLSNTLHSHQEENVYYIGSISVGRIYPNARMRLPLADPLVRELLEWKPDVVHSQCEFSTFPLAKKIAKKSHAPLVHTYHTVYEDYTHYFSPNHAMGKKMTEIFSRQVLKNTTEVIAPSGKVQDMLLNYRVGKPISVVPTGIDLSGFMKARDGIRMRIRQAYGIEKEECVLLYVGRLAKEKNLDEIFRMMTTRKAQGMRLLIVGDGPYREDLERMGERLGISERLIFAGMVPPENISDYYHAGDIFVSASQSETQGLTYMEAMAAGLPIVCKKDSCLKQVITQGRNGFTYETPEEFVNIITCLQADEMKRDMVGDKAKETMKEKFSKDLFVRSLVGVYEQCLICA